MCPLLEDSDPRCAVHQSLHRLDEALTLCMDDYQRCPVYRARLLAHEPHPRQVAEPVRAAG